MQKTTTTVYSFDHKDGTQTLLFLEDNNLVIRSLWANGDIDSEVTIPATVGNLGDLTQALNEMHNEVIGE